MYKRKIISLILSIIFILETVDIDTHAIFNGAKANPGVFPYMVWIAYLKKYRCTGAILDQLHVITAASCFLGGTKVPDYEVVAGSVSSVYQRGETYQAVHVSIPAAYKIAEDGLGHADIAIVTLGKLLPENRLINRITLATGLPRVNRNDPTKKTKLIGWGRTTIDSSAIASKTLLYLSLDFSDQDECRGTLQRHRSYAMGDEHFCVAHGYSNQLRRASGAATGDLGSALVFQDRLVGLVVMPTVDTQSYLPDIYINVGLFAEFYKDVKINEAKNRNIPPTAVCLAPRKSPTYPHPLGQCATDEEYRCGLVSYTNPPQVNQQGRPEQSQPSAAATNQRSDQTASPRRQIHHSFPKKRMGSLIESIITKKFCTRPENLRGHADGLHRINPESYEKVAQENNLQALDLSRIRCGHPKAPTVEFESFMYRDAIAGSSGLQQNPPPIVISDTDTSSSSSSSTSESEKELLDPYSIQPASVNFRPDFSPPQSPVAPYQPQPWSEFHDYIPRPNQPDVARPNQQNIPSTSYLPPNNPSSDLHTPAASPQLRPQPQDISNPSRPNLDRNEHEIFNYDIPPMTPQSDFVIPGTQNQHSSTSSSSTMDRTSSSSSRSTYPPITPVEDQVFFPRPSAPRRPQETREDLQTPSGQQPPYQPRPAQPYSTPHRDADILDYDIPPMTPQSDFVIPGTQNQHSSTSSSSTMDRTSSSSSRSTYPPITPVEDQVFFPSPGAPRRPQETREDLQTPSGQQPPYQPRPAQPYSTPHRDADIFNYDIPPMTPQVDFLIPPSPNTYNMPSSSSSMDHSVSSLSRDFNSPVTRSDNQAFFRHPTIPPSSQATREDLRTPFSLEQSYTPRPPVSHSPDSITNNDHSAEILNYDIPPMTPGVDFVPPDSHSR